MRYVTMSAALASVLLISACGSGGSTTTSSASSTQNDATQTSTISGVVADGYLRGALVCLDINENGSCDEDEPQAYSTSGGAYTLNYSDETALDAPILVEVQESTVDEDDNLTVGNTYTLAAPPQMHEFISPLTKLVYASMKENDINASEAEALIKNELGLDDNVSLLGETADYIQQGQTNIHEMAKAVANYSQVLESPQYQTNATITGVSNEIIRNLSNIRQSVEDAVNNNQEVNASCYMQGIGEDMINGILNRPREHAHDNNASAEGNTTAMRPPHSGMTDDNATVNIMAASTTSSTGNYKLVDTAQTTCYNSTTGASEACTGIGYDADYSSNQPSYTVSGNVVTDNVTGLMWTQSSDLDGDGVTTDAGDKRTYDDAIAYCSALSLDGYDDWRLPDIKTLYSLIRFDGQDPSGPNVDTSTLTTFLDASFSKAFGDETAGERLIDAQYATTTGYVDTTMQNNATMFGVNFVDGRIKGYPVSGKEFYVLCVRNDEEYGLNNLTDNGDGTVTDAATTLMWEQNDTQSTDFDNAVAICEASTTAGHSDWRLPNVKELHSIVDYTRAPESNASAAINPVFNATSITNEKGETDWGYYWSSTTHLNSDGNGSAAAYIAFGRALGNMNGTIMDVHGAGAQRSTGKMELSDAITQSGTDAQGDTYYYKGPQGDIARLNNFVRCVRDAE